MCLTPADDRVREVIETVGAEAPETGGIMLVDVLDASKACRSACLAVGRALGLSVPSRRAHTLESWTCFGSAHACCGSRGSRSLDRRNGWRAVLCRVPYSRRACRSRTWCGSRRRSRTSSFDCQLVFGVELEASPSGAPAGQRLGVHRGSRELFGDQDPAEPLQKADWDALIAAAGPVSGRLGKHELAVRPSASKAKLEAGVAAPSKALASILVLQQLLETQSKILERLTAGRPSDPISAALAGSGSAESGYNTAKGVTAREAYMRVMTRVQDVADATRLAAASELGIDPAAAPPGLMMRMYVERQIPQDHRLLTLFSHYFAHPWEAARLMENKEMEGWLARGLMMTEQMALDSGCSTFGWLLAGLPEPNFRVLIKRKSGLKPYSRLASGSWVAANLAFMKDMDTLETRLRTVNAGNNAPPRRQPPRKPKAAAKGGPKEAAA